MDVDDIPELVIDTGVEAGGCQILTYYDGEVTVLQTARIYFTYIEKSGLLCNSDGHMGYYYDYVYKLDKGKWTSIFSGNYYEFEETDEGEVIDYDEETGRYRTLHYEIDGEETDEMTCLEKLGEVYDMGLAKVPENYFGSDELPAYICENEN
ncbi:hypothetical protein SAMN04487770_12639 [Butyrivibrio sp. ob235]|uniref:hypothetical protein n=1 Tax=Butyrivibrio sp. ob235 TaxID=1761780 RepID=UPI0008BE257B|nr:hypothetical protein [Butyrivibrio sp. ob235]SEM11850.1 hypothetical protein SAMN04487770_12639 [Butyrivibrio sp. ob235]